MADQTVHNQTYNSPLNRSVNHSPVQLAQLPVIDIPELANIVLGFREEILDKLNEMFERCMSQNEILNREVIALRTLVQQKDKDYFVLKSNKTSYCLIPLSVIPLDPLLRLVHMHTLSNLPLVISMWK